MKTCEKSVVCAVAVGFSLLCVGARAESVNWAAYAGQEYTVPAGMEITVSDADIDAFNALASVGFADAEGKLVFTSAKPLTVPLRNTKGTIVKDSPGAWTLETEQTSFRGNWEIAQGIVTNTAKQPFGSNWTKDMRLTVKSGATWVNDNVGLNLYAIDLHLAGTGTAGQGAFVNVKNTTSSTIARLFLDDDALINSVGYFFFQGSSAPANATYVLAGHTLTCSNSTSYFMNGSNSGPGTIRMAKGEFNYRGAHFASSDEGEFVVKMANGTIFDFYNDQPSFDGKLVIEDDATVNVYHAHQNAVHCEADQTHNNIAGPVWIGVGATLRAGVCWNTWQKKDGEFIQGTEWDAQHLWITGPISGPGSLEFFGGSAGSGGAWGGEVYVGCPTNDYMGQTFLRYSDRFPTRIVTLAGTNAIPDYAKTTVDGGVFPLTVGEGEGEWPMTAVARFVAQVKYVGKGVTSVDASHAAEKTVAITADTFAADDTRPVFECRVMPATDDTRVELVAPLGRAVKFAVLTNDVFVSGEGAVDVTNGTAESRAAFDGRVTFDSVKEVVVTNNTMPFRVSAAYGMKDLVLSDSNILLPMNTANYAESAADMISIGWRPDENTPSRGSMTVADDSVVTARIQVAGQNYAVGRLIQKGGAVCALSSFDDSRSGYSSGVGMGYESYGYFELQGGRFTSLGYFNMAKASSANGVIWQKGGDFEVLKHPASTGSATEAWMNMSQSGSSRSHFRISGGHAVWTGSQLFRGGSCRSVVTADGAGALLEAQAGMNYGYDQGMVSVVNANDGATIRSIYATRFKWETGTDSYSKKGWVPMFYINANGGRLRSSGSGYMFGPEPGPGNLRPTHLTVYEKGLILDATNTSQNIYASIEAARGMGVRSIALPEPVDVSGVSPFVEIVDVGGTGYGASAFAVVDEASGKIVRFDVTSAGCNYTDAKAVWWFTDGRYGHTVHTNDCVMAENGPDGGLTIEGTTGSIYLYATNTYTGPTVLRSGRLYIQADDVISSESRFVLGECALNMNGHTIGGRSFPADWGADIALAVEKGSALVYPGDFEFPADATLTVTGGEALRGLPEDVRRVDVFTVSGRLANAPAPEVEGWDDALTGDWSVRWVGKTLRAVRRRGTLLLVR